MPRGREVAARAKTRVELRQIRQDSSYAGILGRWSCGATTLPVSIGNDAVHKLGALGVVTHALDNLSYFAMHEWMRPN